MSQATLVSEILRLSRSPDWLTAHAEWKLKHIFDCDEPETCLCGHYPIKEICTIANSLTSHECAVGNCCVMRFGIAALENIFAALRRVKRDKTSSLNVEAIEHAHDKSWFNPWETAFYLGMWRKRKLSTKQLAVKIKLNAAFISRCSA